MLPLITRDNLRAHCIGPLLSAPFTATLPITTPPTSPLQPGGKERGVWGVPFSQPPYLRRLDKTSCDKAVLLALMSHVRLKLKASITVQLPKFPHSHTLPAAHLCRAGCVPAWLPGWLHPWLADFLVELLRDRLADLVPH